MMRRYVTAVIGLALVLTLVIGFGQRSAPVVSAAGEGQVERLISVNGEGEIEAKPDQAIVQVAVETTGDTAQAALQANSRDTAQVIATLKKLGIAEKDIQTTQLQLYPLYAPKEPVPQQEAPKVIGFRAVNGLSVTVQKLDNVGSSLDAVVSAGANRVQGISFGFSNPKALEDQALQLAMEDARHQAELVARAAGVQIKGIRNISVSGGGYPIRKMALAYGDQAAVPVMPGEMTIRMQVSVTFEF